MALSMLPYFLAKFFVGGSSGWLLARYCPTNGPRDSGFMWFLVGCMALVTPLGAFLFRKQIQVQEEGREPVVETPEVAAKESKTLHE